MQSEARLRGAVRCRKGYARMGTVPETPPVVRRGTRTAVAGNRTVTTRQDWHRAKRGNRRCCAIAPAISRTQRHKPRRRMLTSRPDKSLQRNRLGGFRQSTARVR